MINTTNAPLLLVGTGPMAIEYARVLASLSVPYIAVGRGMDSAQRFEKETGVRPETGGVEAWAETLDVPAPRSAIVACGEKWIGVAARCLINAGVKRLLVEKPGGFDAQDIVHVHSHAEQANAEVFVGYNRRFYASVRAARDLIQEDGGVMSFSFEFTEWSHVIAGLHKEDGVKEQWFLSNSTHLIDLAFFLGGKPERWETYTAGGLDWHPLASVFAGAGKTETGALFSYHANWEAPGRFSLEILTRKHRLIFRPVESLQIQNIGSVAIAPVEIDDELDKNFKPGIYRQTQAFLSEGSRSNLTTLAEQVSMLPYYIAMRGDKQGDA